MRILFAADEHTYSAYALNKATRLAMNTWADVTLLAVLANSSSSSSITSISGTQTNPLSTALSKYREDFLAAWDGAQSPYAEESWCYRWMPVRNGLWEEIRVCLATKKDLKVRLRSGNAADEILAEAMEGGSDLIIIGCSKGAECAWSGNLKVPQKVVSNANTSVLLVKEDLPINKIIACVDQTPISQESLEMINQMVTIHDADLELIGLTKGGGVDSKSYAALMELGDYYNKRGMKSKTQLVEISDFENFITAEAKGDLFALWMGKKSLLDRFFSRDWVERFASSCRSSVLVLR